MKFSILIPFFAIVLALTAACGTGSPTIVVDSQIADEMKRAAVELFDDWREATKKHDAKEVHELLASNIADRCTVGQLERFFEISRNAFTYPDMGVKEVFVSAGNPEEAFIKMELLGEPKEGDQGLRDAYVAALPFPIVREDGRWRMVLQYPILGDGCPFVYSSSSQEPVPSENSTPNP